MKRNNEIKFCCVRESKFMLLEKCTIENEGENDDKRFF